MPLDQYPGVPRDASAQHAHLSLTEQVCQDRDAREGHQALSSNCHGIEGLTSNSPLWDIMPGYASIRLSVNSMGYRDKSNGKRVRRRGKVAREIAPPVSCARPSSRPCPSSGCPEACAPFDGGVVAAPLLPTTRPQSAAAPRPKEASTVRLEQRPLSAAVAKSAPSLPRGSSNREPSQQQRQHQQQPLQEQQIHAGAPRVPGLVGSRIHRAPSVPLHSEKPVSDGRMRRSASAGTLRPPVPPPSAAWAVLPSGAERAPAAETDCRASGAKGAPARVAEAKGTLAEPAHGTSKLPASRKGLARAQSCDNLGRRVHSGNEETTRVSTGTASSSTLRPPWGETSFETTVRPQSALRAPRRTSAAARVEAPPAPPRRRGGVLNRKNVQTEGGCVGPRKMSADSRRCAQLVREHHSVTTKRAIFC